MRAHNVHIRVEESEVIVRVAAQSIETPYLPTSTGDHYFVKISLTAPYKDSLPITNFSIYVSDVDCEFLNESTYCDVEREPVFTNFYCVIIMANLHLEPYRLQFDDEILVKIQLTARVVTVESSKSVTSKIRSRL